MAQKIGITVLILAFSVLYAINCVPLNDKKKPQKSEKYEFKKLSNDTFRIIYNQPDGQEREEFSVEKDGHVKTNGTYSYIGDDGKTYSVQYTADKKGLIKCKKLVTLAECDQTVMDILKKSLYCMWFTCE